VCVGFARTVGWLRYEPGCLPPSCLVSLRRISTGTALSRLGPVCVTRTPDTVGSFNGSTRVLFDNSGVTLGRWETAGFSPLPIASLLGV